MSADRASLFASTQRDGAATADDRFAAERPVCDDCGYDDLNCQCEDDFGAEWDCTTCGGEGHLWGEEMGGDYGWYLPDHLYDCWNCRGSGNRRDQRVF